LQGFRPGVLPYVKREFGVSGHPDADKMRETILLHRLIGERADRMAGTGIKTALVKMSPRKARRGGRLVRDATAAAESGST
jgi:hypothetical protein